MEGFAFWAAAVAASVLVGMGKGGMPVVAMMGVPVLSLVIDPIAAAGLLLPVYIVSDIFGLYTYRHNFNKTVLLIMVPAMLIGVGLAWAMASIVPGSAVTALVGAIGTVFALNALLKRQSDVPAKDPQVAPGLFWGTVSGFTSFVIHSGGPPFQVYALPLKMPKLVYAGTFTIAFATVNLAKVFPYYSLGDLNPTNLEVAAILAVPASLAVFVGVRMVKIIPEVLFFRIVTWALLVLSLRLLWVGLVATLGAA